MTYDCDEREEVSQTAAPPRRRRSARRRSARRRDRRAALTTLGFLLLLAGLALAGHYCLVLDPTASGPMMQASDAGDVIVPISADLRAECRSGLLVGLLGAALGAALVGVGRKSSPLQSAAPGGRRPRHGQRGRG